MTLKTNELGSCSLRRLARAGAMALGALCFAGCSATSETPGSDAGDAAASNGGHEAGSGDDSSAATPDSGGSGDDATTGDDSLSTEPDSSGTGDDGGLPQPDASTVDGSAVPTPPPDYLWYVLDETQGTTAHDSSGHHFDITNMTGVTWNQGANFDGTNGGGNTTLDSAYRSPPITISAWLTPNLRTDAPNRLVLKPYPPNAISGDIPGVGGFGIGLNVWSSGSALADEGLADCTTTLCVANATQNAAAADSGVDGGPSCTSATSCNQGFVAGTEHLIVMTVAPFGDAGARVAAAVYVDGTLFDQTTSGAQAPSAAPPLHLGRHNLDGNYGTDRIFDGRIRDVRIYKRELGGDEIQQLNVNGPTLRAPAQLDAGSADAASE